jgi:hypothetical protein
MLLEAETNKYCPGGYDFGAISNLITWVLNFFFECGRAKFPLLCIISRRKKTFELAPANFIKKKPSNF